jgi:hypothetical protein
MREKSPRANLLLDSPPLEASACRVENDIARHAHRWRSLKILLRFFSLLLVPSSAVENEKRRTEERKAAALDFSFNLILLLYPKHYSALYEFLYMQ